MEFGDNNTKFIRYYDRLLLLTWMVRGDPADTNCILKCAAMDVHPPEPRLPTAVPTERHQRKWHPLRLRIWRVGDDDREVRVGSL